MKIFGALAAAVLGQGVEYCGPDAANGGAFWPGQSAEDPCGIHYVDSWVGANMKCTLTIQDATAVPHFITLGGVFVTSQQMPGDYQYFFHTYDNWAGNYGGVDVTIFWENADAPDGTTGCLNADQVCISCEEETVDYNGDGAVGPVQGVYIGNFMHDFRHTSPSCVNVPIANSAGHVNGTVYTVTIYDEYAQAVPIENIASHYSGHTITASGTDGASGASSATGSFDLHVGCNDFNGQFLYFSFCHSTEQEGSGWFSSVTASAEVPQDCEAVEPAPYTDPYASGGDGYTDPYNSGENKQAAATSGRPNKRPNKNKNNKQRSEYDYNSYNDTQYYDDGQYYGNYNDYNYRK